MAVEKRARKSTRKGLKGKAKGVALVWARSQIEGDGERRETSCRNAREREIADSSTQERERERVHG